MRADPALSATRIRAARPGWFVEPEDPRRLGKVHRVLDDTIEVAFFHGTSRTEIEAFPAARVARTYLSRQTRVYILGGTDERWAMGRIRGYQLQDDGSVTYEVRLPNKRDCDIPETRLYARCLASAVDPSEVLAAGAGETQRFHDARWAARTALTNLRSAAYGLTGLTSASIELVPHQAEAVRRVLTDPLQRYLLADEVGLGKTIEAGSVIRQALIDEPGRRVVVAAPESLVPQWRHELAAKFGLQTGPDSAVRLVSHQYLSTLRESLDLLVVDEAHRLAAGSGRAEALSRVVRQTSKLLLLSATPALGQEDALLALLRWLDPARWDGESLEGFRVHVAKRQEYGRLLLGLRPEGSAFALKQRANLVKAQFAADATALELADALLDAIDRPNDRGAACLALREHLADAYRIHHRVIRSRRSDLEGWEFQPRGPASLRVEGDDDGRLPSVAAALEDWRMAAQRHADACEATATRLVERYRGLIEAVGRGVAALGACLPGLLPSFPGEEDLLVELGRAAVPGEVGERRAAFVATVVERELQFLRRKGAASPKVVVFVTGGNGRTAIVDAVAARLDPASVADLDGIDRFRRDPTCAVAVLDEAGEEGLNLAFADALIHADLPFSAVRMEQRTGRADRFGRRKGPIRHTVVLPDDEDEEVTWTAWLRILREGLGLFDRPLSDVQFVLEAVESEAHLRLFRSGTAGLDDYCAAVRARIEAERTLLDEQYALDQSAVPMRSAGEALVTVIEAAEEDEEAVGASVRKLLVDLLQFRLARTEQDDVFTLHWEPDTLLPVKPWREVFEGVLGRPMTWRRRTAVARTGVALLRPGAPLVDALENLMDWDDRGSAFATWRYRPGAGGPGRETLAFRLCWLVEPDAPTEDLLAAEDPAGLRRRAAGYLRPWTLVQHLDADGAPIADAELVELLEAPYQPDRDERSYRDFNLGSRPAWLYDLVEPGEFARLCGVARDQGLRLLRDGPDWAARIEAAAAAAGAEARKRRRRFAARLAEAPDPTAARDLELDALLLQAVRRPRARLDALGAMVVAGYVPREASA